MSFPDDPPAEMVGGGLTQEQAAEALGVAVRTAKRRWRDARLALSDERRITA